MKQIFTLVLLIFIAMPAYAQQAQTVAIAGKTSASHDALSYIQKEWATIKYRVPDKSSKLEKIAALEAYASRANNASPHNPALKIWEGIVLSTDAGITKNMSGLPKVKKAKALFEEALAIDPKALDGSAYTSLGSLYYQVPGWPISFGDNDEAEKHLKQALAINPDGIDANFFYGDFLLQNGRYGEAVTVLEHALQAAPRPDRPLADAGRHQEIQAALAEAREKSQPKDDKAARYN